jgi:hypothetical protein
VDVAIFIFDTNAGPTPTVIPVMIPETFSAIPIAMDTVATIAISSATFIPIAERAIAVTITLTAIPHAFVIALALLLRWTTLRSLPGRRLSETRAQAADQKCRDHHQSTHANFLFIGRPPSRAD